MSRHVSAEQLARRHEGVVGARKAARIDAHLSACDRCAATSSDLGAVSSLLAATPLPPMPDYLSQRLQLAIATESADRAARSSPSPAGAGAPAGGTVGVPDPGGAGDGGPAHIPGRPDLPERAGRAPRRFRMPGLSSPLVLRGLAATAAVVVIAGAGFLLASGQAGLHSESTSGGGSTRAAVPSTNGPAAPTAGQANRYVGLHYHVKGKVMTTTALAENTNFTRHSLARQVRERLSKSVGFGQKSASTGPVPTVKPTLPASGLGTGLNVSKLDGCLSRVDAGRTVLLADVARYLGKPATIIVLRSLKSAGILDVLVVGSKCSASVADMVLQTAIPAS